ncbi:MAG: hypothetical protein K0U41_00470 [Gammaproteobacteria bacterium]|nr:hypothetical protein [Gammaproteobacteria bacterium]
MDYKKETKRIIASAEIALKQLDKLIIQNIDLEELDPEKAKAAAQGKIEAIEGSFKIIQRIQEELGTLDPTSKNESQDFLGVETRIK